MEPLAAIGALAFACLACMLDFNSAELLKLVAFAAIVIRGGYMIGLTRAR